MRLIAVLFLLSSGVAAMAQTDVEKKRALEEAFALSAGEHLGEGILKIPTSYVYENDQLTGQHFIGTYFPTNVIMTNEGIMTIFYAGEHFGGAEAKTGCGKEERPDFNPWSAEFDDRGKVVRLEHKNWMENGQGFSKSWFTFQYANDRMIAMNRGVINGTGGSKNDVTATYESKINAVALDWKNESEVTITVSLYKNRIAAADQEVIAKQVKYVCRISPGNLSYATFTGNRETLVEFSPGDHQVVQTRTNSQNPDKRETTFFLDDNKRVLKISDVIFKGDHIGKRTETSVQYISVTQGAPDGGACGYRIRNIVNIFDGSGTQLQESNDTMIRKRNKDGTWGQWQAMPD